MDERQFILRTGDERAACAVFVSRLPAEPVMEVTVRPYKSKRSVEQNRLYWGVYLKTIADHTGHTAEELHELFKAKFLYRENLTVCGTDLPMFASTTKLNTREFTDFLDRVQQFAQHELGCYLPADERYA